MRALKPAPLSVLLGLALSLSTAAKATVIYSDDSSSLDLFGSVSALCLSGHAAHPDRPYGNAAADSAIASRSIVGLAMRSRLGDHLDAIAMAQWDMTNGELDSATDYLYTGIDAYEYGTLIAGQAENAYYAVVGTTDIFHFLESRGNDAYFMDDKLPGQLLYRFSALSYDLRLSYMTSKDQVNDTPFSVSHQIAASVSGRVSDRISFAYGLVYTNFSYAGADNRQALGNYFGSLLARDYNWCESEAERRALSSHKIEAKYDYGAALSYGVLGEGLYASVNFTVSDYDYLKHKIYSTEGAVSYTFDNGMELLGGLNFEHYDGFCVISDLNLGAAWNLAPSFKVFCEGTVDLGADPERFYGSAVSDYLTENKFVLGAEFSF